MRYLQLLAVLFGLFTATSAAAEPTCRFLTPCDATAIAYSRRGDMVAVGFRTGEVKLYDSQLGRLLRRIQTGESISCLVFTRSGQSIITGGSDGKLACWNVTTGLLEQQDRCERSVELLILSESGNRLAVVIDPNDVQLWNASSTRWERSLRIGVADKVVQTVSFLHDSEYLTVGGSAREVGIYETHNGFLRMNVGIPWVIESIAVSPDNSQLAIASTRNVVLTFDIPSRQFQRNDLGVPVSTVSYNRSGELTIGTKDNLVVLTERELCTPKAVFTYHLRHGSIVCLRLSPDGRKVLSLSEGGAVYLWDKTFATPLR